MLIANFDSPTNMAASAATENLSHESAVADSVIPSLYVCRSDLKGKYYTDRLIQQRKAEYLQFFKTHLTTLGVVRSYKRQVARLVDLIEKSERFQLADISPDFTVLRQQFGGCVSGWFSFNQLSFIQAELAELATLESSERQEALLKLKDTISERMYIQISASAQLLDLEGGSIKSAMSGYDKLAKMCFLLENVKFHTPINKKQSAEVCRYLRDNNYTRVLELNAGNGWWAKALSEDSNGEPINVIATDNFSLDSAKVARNLKHGYLSEDENVQELDEALFKEGVLTKFTTTGADGVEYLCTTARPAQVEHLSASEAIAKYSEEVDLVLVVRADYPEIVDALMQLPKDKKILWVGASSFLESLHRFKAQTFDDNAHKEIKSIGFHESDAGLSELNITLPDQNEAAVISLLSGVYSASTEEVETEVGQTDNSRAGKQ